MKNTNAFAVAGAMVTAGLAISLGAAFSSCSSENYSLGMSRRRAQTEVKENYSHYVVPKKNNLLYVTVPGLTDQPMTRADGEEMTTLESLLDRGQTKSESFYQFR